MEFIILHQNKELNIYNFQTGKLFYNYSHNSTISSFDLSEDSKVLVFSDYKGNIIYLSLIYYRIFKKIETNQMLISIKVTSSIDRVLALYDKSNIINIQIYPNYNYKLFNYHNALITDFIIINDKNIYVTVGLDNKIVFINLKNNNILRALNNFQSYVSKILYNDNYLYTLSFDDEIKVWDLKNLRFKKYLYLDIGTIIDLKFNSKNVLVISNISKEIIERDLVNNNNKITNTVIYPEKIDTTKFNKVIYSNDKNEIYCNNKLIIKNVFNEFRYIYFKKNNTNCFDLILNNYVELLIKKRLKSIVNINSLSLYFNN